MKRLKIIFVCLGNYFRSPMVEAIFLDLARHDGTLNHFEVSSAGTKDWDIGLRPDYRTCKILDDNGIPLDPNKRAKKITDKEINTADYLIVMSKRVAKEIGNQDNVYLLLDFVNDIDDKDIPDPYPSNTFPRAYELINRGVKEFYKYLKENHQKNHLD